MTSPAPPESAEAPPILYVRAPHAAWRQIGDEMVVLDQKGHRLVALNQAAGTVWHRLDAPRSVETLAMILSSRDETGVQTFLEELAQLGLLERTTNGELPSPANDDSLRTFGSRVEIDSAPAILWQEPIQNAAQTSACAFLPGQNPLCNSVPFS